MRSRTIRYDIAEEMEDSLTCSTASLFLLSCLPPLTFFPVFCSSDFLPLLVANIEGSRDRASCKFLLDGQKSIDIRLLVGNLEDWKAGWRGVYKRSEGTKADVGLVRLVGWMMLCTAKVLLEVNDDNPAELMLCV